MDLNKLFLSGSYSKETTMQFIEFAKEHGLYEKTTSFPGLSQVVTKEIFEKYKDTLTS